MAPMRRTAVLACALLGLAPLLAACGDDEEAGATKVGDVIPANEDDQFEGRRASTVLVPSGRLKVWLGKPVDAVERNDTRQLEELQAPDGASLVPVTWRMETAFPDATGFLGATPAIGVDLVTDGESYRLPAPDPESEAGESFYVVTDGDGEDVSLAVEFDGVTQTIDLRTRERDAGLAAALYEIDDTRLRPEDCGSEDWHDERVIYACELTGPLLLPYANGEWADKGHQWLAVRLYTTLRQWGIADGEGGGALYIGGRTKLEATLDEEKPVATFDGALNECPVQGNASCMAERLLIFDVEKRDVPTKLEVEQEFKLALLNRWGGYSPKERISDSIGGSLRFDLPEG